MEERPLSWLPTGECLSFGFTPEERSLVVCALREYAGKSSRPEARLTDEQILNAAITAADALDATRVSEMVAGGWNATTIFEGDTGLIRFGRLVESLTRGPQE